MDPVSSAVAKLDVKDVSETKNNPSDLIRSKELYSIEYKKLFDIIENVLSDLERKHVVASSFRFFKVVVGSDPSIVHDNMVKFRDEILTNSKLTLHEILLKVRDIEATGYAGNIKKIPTLKIAPIYKLANELQQSAKKNLSFDTGNLQIGPEIIRLHIARICNMIAEDERLTKEIETLEKTLRADNNPTVVTQMPMNLSGMLGGFANMARQTLSSGNVPEQFRSIIQAAPSLLDPSKFNETGTKGINEKIRDTLKSNPEVIKFAKNFVDNDMVKNAVQSFSSFASSSGFAPEGFDAKNLDLAQIISKIEEDLAQDKSPSTESEEGKCVEPSCKVEKETETPKEKVEDPEKEHEPLIVL